MRYCKLWAVCLSVCFIIYAVSVVMTRCLENFTFHKPFLQFHCPEMHAFLDIYFLNSECKHIKTIQHTHIYNLANTTSSLKHRASSWGEWKDISGGSCRKYNFCRDKHVCHDKHVFVTTKHVFCCDKSMLATIKLLSL